MSDTASPKIYRVRQSVHTAAITKHLTKDLRYEAVGMAPLIQEKNEVKLMSYAQESHPDPDWLDLIKPYMKDSKQIKQSLRYDFIMLIQCRSSDGQTHTFAFCGGSGYSHIADFVDHSFGISILESVFDPKYNKVAAIAEKGVLGDVLASRRFYRRARSIAYEEDFGKYYQAIDARFSNSQIQQRLPTFAAKKRKKLKPTISISGSSGVEIRTRISLYELIVLVKDLAELTILQFPPIFNKALAPLDPRIDKQQIIELNEGVLDRIVDYCLDPISHPVDIDFCHRDFEAFYGSDLCEITIHDLPSASSGAITLQFDDVYSFGDANLSYIGKIFDKVKSDPGYHKASDKTASAKTAFKSIDVVTMNDQGHLTTSGKFLEYLQMEVHDGGISYFLLDTRWYRLRSQFDSMLTAKYVDRVSHQFVDRPFIHHWNGPDETAYNQLYDDQPKSVYLHLIKVDHVELCDALILDMPNERAYVVHVKDGLGATMRDLTSQVHMAARIIEEAARGADKTPLIKLYDQASTNGRINSKVMTKDEFLQRIESFEREYILAIHDATKTSSDIKAGNFESRIAKFSLVEFASAMRVNNWQFSITCIAS